MTKGPRQGISLVLGGICAACSGRPVGDLKGDAPEVLAPLTDLSVTMAGDDPLPSHRPADIECSGLTGWYLEGDALEVNTGACNYLSLSEPAATSAAAGEIVLTEISHFDLTSPDPAEAHIALLVGDQIFWETTIAIPGPANVLEVAAALPQDVSAGDPITLHLHNHGQNTWNIAPLLIER